MHYRKTVYPALWSLGLQGQKWKIFGTIFIVIVFNNSTERCAFVIEKLEDLQ